MLDLLCASPKPMAFGARTLLVGALKMRELGTLQRWVRDHWTRPVAALKGYIDLIPEAERRQALREAHLEERLGVPAIGTAEGNTILLADPDGQRTFVRVMLEKHNPGFSEADLDATMGGLSQSDFVTLFRVAFGEDDLDPEALRAEARAAPATAAARAAIPSISGDSS